MNKQLEQLRSNREKEQAALDEKYAAEFAKLTQGDKDTLESSLSAAADAFSNLRQAGVELDLRSGEYKAALTTLGLSAGKVRKMSKKSKAAKPAGGRSAPRPGTKIKRVVKKASSTIEEIAADTGLTEAEVKSYLEKKSASYKKTNDKYSFIKK